MALLEALQADLAREASEIEIDMTRGNPSREQEALSLDMLKGGVITHCDGVDVLNYGGLEGLPSARRLFGEYLDVPPENVIVQNNSSLTLMHDLIVQGLLRGVCGELWKNSAFICPVPGYDRHFAICERYGIRMIPVALNEDGPDMDEVERHAKDERVVGMWCVPKYSNPTGITYSNQVVKRIAAMEAAYPAFRVFWDCAYMVHDLYELNRDDLYPFMQACRDTGNPDRWFIFGSMSKITFAGAGVAAVGMSERNLHWFRQGLQVQTIGPNKLPQAQHVAFLPDLDAIRVHMRSHRKMLAPKFAAVDEVFRKRFGGRNDVHWSNPKGGYFISVQTPDGCAKRVVELAASAGVKMTPAGAAFPYGNNVADNHLRIAPTMQSEESVRIAARIIALAIEIATLEMQG